MEFSVVNILAFVAMGMMVIVTGGILYLTAIEWRDRRRQDEEKRQRN